MVSKLGSSNESLTQKPTTSMDGVITAAEYYIKGEESNMEKRSRDAKEKIRAKEEGTRHRNEYPKPEPRDQITMRPSW